MGGLDIQVVSAMSVNEFKRVVHDSDDVDVLVISAHGFYEKSSNVSGFVVGRERLIGHDLDHVPPLVLLSACHVSPRGAGSVTVVDLLLRAGATAVLGTMVPVDVRHNSILMARLLLHISGSSYLRVG
jgi:CHAT domain-containing protein